MNRLAEPAPLDTAAPRIVSARLELGSPPLRFAAGLAAAEIVLLTAKLLTGFSLTAWLLCHIALTGAAAAHLWQHRVALTDVTPYALTVIAAFISGPIGATLSVIALVRHSAEASSPELLAAWYDRIALAGDVDPVTDLYNTVAMGRALHTSMIPPQVFDAVMLRGTLADRQTALGLIARQFEPSYAPALRSALVSPEPVIRVQAAAVAVKVRAGLKVSLAHALARATASPAVPAAAGLALDLQAMAKSGLLEDDDRDRAVEAAANLTNLVISKLDESGPISEAAKAMIETELLARGRFEDFRELRARKPAASNPCAPQGFGGPNV